MDWLRGFVVRIKSCSTLRWIARMVAFFWLFTLLTLMVAVGLFDWPQASHAVMHKQLFVAAAVALLMALPFYRCPHCGAHLILGSTKTTFGIADWVRCTVRLAWRENCHCQKCDSALCR